MEKDFSSLPEEDRLRAENEYLKMKLMLETGMQFGGNAEILERMPELENEFLRSVAAFEKQWGKSRKVTVFEKIGKPGFFKPVDEIPDNQIEDCWKELFHYMEEHGVYLQACSPNISNRELYRFAIEELFNEETDDMFMPGVQTCFIYDEFHPDRIYENSGLVESCVRDIFSKHDLFYEIHYNEQGFLFNQTIYAKWSDFAAVINKFKSFYEEIELMSFHVASCDMQGDVTVVIGSYSASANSPFADHPFEGNFHVELCKTLSGSWNINSMVIEGFDPA